MRVGHPKTNRLQGRLDVEFPCVQQPAQKQGEVNVTCYHNVSVGLV